MPLAEGTVQIDATILRLMKNTTVTLCTRYNLKIVLEKSV